MNKVVNEKHAWYDDEIYTPGRGVEPFPDPLTRLSWFTIVFDKQFFTLVQMDTCITQNPA